MPPIKQVEKNQPQWFIVKSLALLIAIGTLLLLLPQSVRPGARVDLMTAIFTATSAASLTGHILFDVVTHYSLFGQLVLLALIQIGGMGFMFMGTLLLKLAGRHLSIQNEQALLDVLRLDEAVNLRALLKRAVFYSIALETAGAIILAWRFSTAYGYAPARACYMGIFHAVSAYCNAGLTLFPGNLVGFRYDSVIIITLTCLVVAGGVGFVVIYDLSQYKFWRHARPQRGHLMLHSKIVLTCTAVLICFGALGFMVLEWEAALNDLSLPHKIMTALFQSVSARSAGFNIIELTAIQPSTRFMNMFLMFIGGSPGSTAGGIKTTTMVVLLATTISMVRGRQEVTLINRTISIRNIKTALTITILGIALAAVGFGLLLVTASNHLANNLFTSDYLMFETISTCGAVGLSTGSIPLFSTAGKIIVMLCMFIGRTGPLTIAMVVGAKTRRHLLRYPEEDVLVG